ncbi:MAG: pyocin knob domain-containing protein [Paracoccaceae bacterium]
MVDTTALQYLPVPQAQFATWQPDLVRLENGWWPTGGAVDPPNDGGIMNWQAQVLGERTEYLKYALGGIGDIAFTATSLNAIAETGIRNYVNGVTGNPLAGADGRVLHIAGAANASQMAVTSTGRMFWRIRTGASWSTWSEAVSVENGGDIEGDLSVAGLFSLDGTGEINGPVDVVGADAFSISSVSTEVDPAWKWYLTRS